MSNPLKVLSIRTLSTDSILAKDAPSSDVGTFTSGSLDIVVELEEFEEQAVIHKTRPTKQYNSLGCAISAGYWVGWVNICGQLGLSKWMSEEVI